MANIDDILVDIGELGRYQLFIYILLCVATIFPIININIGMFLTPIINHRCAVSETDSLEIKDTLHEALLNKSIPTLYDNASCAYVFSKCEVYDVNGSAVGCSSFVFDHTTFQSTAMEDYALVCGWDEWRTYTMMATMVGMTVGSFVCGNLADRYGRKIVFLVSNICLVIMGVLCAWAPNLAYFAFYRFAGGVCSYGVYLVVFVLGVELVGHSKRLWSGIVINFTWAFGAVILAGLAYRIRDWHYLQLAIVLPQLLFISYFWIIPESPRWLLANGRHAEAMAVLETIARYNKTMIPQRYKEGVLIDEKDSCDASRKGVGGDDNVEKVWQLCGTGRLAVWSSVLVVNWLAVTISYYGLVIHAGTMSENIYMNLFLSGVVEFPAYILCLLLLDRLGRRILHTSCMIVSGVACICSILPVVFEELPECQVGGFNIASLALSLVGKLGASAGFAVIYVYTAELFPTTIRSGAMGVCSTLARTGGIVAPYIANMNIGGTFGVAFPLLVFGTFTLVAGLSTLLLPETLGRPLPDTLEDAERFGRVLHRDLATQQKSNGKCAVSEELKPTLA